MALNFIRKNPLAQAYFTAEDRQRRTDQADMNYARGREALLQSQRINPIRVKQANTTLTSAVNTEARAAEMQGPRLRQAEGTASLTGQKVDQGKRTESLAAGADNKWSKIRGWVGSRDMKSLYSEYHPSKSTGGSAQPSAASPPGGFDYIQTPAPQNTGVFLTPKQQAPTQQYISPEDQQAIRDPATAVAFSGLIGHLDGLGLTSAQKNAAFALVMSGQPVQDVLRKFANKTAGFGIDGNGKTKNTTSQTWMMKRNAWLSVHPKDINGALEYANGRSGGISSDKIRLFAYKRAMDERNALNTDAAKLAFDINKRTDEIVAGFMRNQGAQAPAPQAPAPQVTQPTAAFAGTQPPTAYPDARRAQDGNWYVWRNGGWNRISGQGAGVENGYRHVQGATGADNPVAGMTEEEAARHIKGEAIVR